MNRDWWNYIAHAQKAQERPDHKYIARVEVGTRRGKILYRYFYTMDQYKRYLSGKEKGVKTELEKRQNPLYNLKRLGKQFCNLLKDHDEANNGSSINNYGLISRHIYVDGKANTEDSLYEAASKELKNYKQSAEPTLTVKSFDRRDAGETVEKLGYLLRTHILSEPHDIDRWMVCTKVKLPLDGPNSKEFTFGLTSKKLSKRVTSIFDMAASMITGIKGLIGYVNEVWAG